jgi:hypothetical protein
LLSNVHPPHDTGPDSYRFVQHWLGFRVEHPCRHTVEVTIEPGGFVFKDGVRVERRDLLYPPLELVRLIARLLLGVYGLAETRRSSRLMREEWAITAPVYALRAELLDRLGRGGSRVQRALQEVCGSVPAFARSDVFLRHPFLARDVANYRAAAIALAFLEPLLRERNNDRRRGPVRLTDEVLAEAMSDWRGLFSPDGAPYKSLNRTLMNLSADVPAALVCFLSYVKLERAIVSPVELTALLVFVSQFENEGRMPEDRLRIFQQAREEEIRQAFGRIGAETERELEPTLRDDVRFAVRYLNDFPERCGRDLSVWVERTLRWHARPARPVVARVRAMPVFRDTRTARARMRSPGIKGVTFLKTVGAVVAEGERMHHCIAAYAERAVRGEVFLYHVEHEGETASFALDREGRIIEAAGPCNRNSGAVHWGKKIFTEWVAKCRARPRRPRPIPGQLSFPFAEVRARPL